MKQPDKRTPFLFITLGIVTILLLLIDMATGDTYIPITKVWAVLTGRNDTEYSPFYPFHTGSGSGFDRNSTLR